MNKEQAKLIGDKELELIIAKILGYTNLTELDTALCDFEDMDCYWEGKPPNNSWSRVVPRFTNDLNPCHGFEKLIRGDLQKELNYATALLGGRDVGRWENGFPTSETKLWHATARQRCEAFVMTMELGSTIAQKD